MIIRDEYLKKLESAMWDGNIKVITGLRRSGKSTLLFELFYDYLISAGVDEGNVIKLKLDERKHYIYRNPIALCDMVEKILEEHSDEKYYLFIDEVQMAKKTLVKNEYGSDEVSIYDMLNELRGYKNLDVYVTGSNSKMLSSDIATEFRGRSTQIHVYPLSFKEMYSFYGGNEKDVFEIYKRFGGMPELTNKKTEREKMEYLGNLFSETYIKDLREHGRIQREDILSDILNFLASNVGSLTNPTNIANTIESMTKEKIDRNLVNSYIEKLKDAFLISEVKRYDVKGKMYFDYPNKYYYADVGLRNARLNYRQFDKGHIMENIVYNELIRRGYKVDVGVVYDRREGKNVQKEIDFVVNDMDRRIYIQSAFEMNNEEKEESELRSFVLTGDFFKKIAIRDDISHHYYDDKGFLHCGIEDFLMERVELF
ncbi:MAG: ATP-binding protein [Erysipelotrichaceae bacterium]